MDPLQHVIRTYIRTVILGAVRPVQDGPKGPDRKEIAAWHKSAIVRDFQDTSSLKELEGHS